MSAIHIPSIWLRWFENGTGSLKPAGSWDAMTGWCWIRDGKHNVWIQNWTQCMLYSKQTEIMQFVRLLAGRELVFRLVETSWEDYGKLDYYLSMMTEYGTASKPAAPKSSWPHTAPLPHRAHPPTAYGGWGREMVNDGRSDDTTGWVGFLAPRVCRSVWISPAVRRRNPVSRSNGCIVLGSPKRHALKRIHSSSLVILVSWITPSGSRRKKEK